MALRNKPILIFSAISFLLVLMWYSDGGLFAGGEEGIIFYDLEKHQQLISSVWYDIEVGLPAVAFLGRIPYFFVMKVLGEIFPSIFLQAFTFWFLLTVGSCSVYFVARELFQEKQIKTSISDVAYISGVFYIFNPYSLTQVWGRGLYPQFFAFAFAPLFLLFFIKLVKERKIYYLAVASLISIFFASAFVIITNFVVIWAIIFLYLAHILFHQKRLINRFHLVIYFLLFFASWAAVNAWWIMPNFSSLFVYSNAISANNENLGTLLGVSAHFPLSSIIRLMQRHYFFIAKSYGDIYTTPAFIIISWLLPVIAFFSVSYFKQLKNLKFIYFVFFIGLLVSLGANRPFGKIFIWFFETFPALQAFRNPYEKFGLVIMFAYSFIFALGLVRVTVKKPLIKLGVMILICGIFVWPFWKGVFAGKYAWTKVPQYYKSANEWLNSKEGDFRIIQLPLVSGDGVLYEWEKPYNGIEPSAFLFTRQSIGRNVGVKSFYNVLLQRFGNFSPGIFGLDPDITNSGFREDNLWQELAKLNVRYIVFHNDLDDHGIGKNVTTEDFRRYLTSEEKINKVISMGALDIYEVDIPENVALIYSPDATVNYKKLNPAHYIGEVTDFNKDNVEIYFLNQFNNNWKLTINGIVNENHFVAYSYANGWKIRENDLANFEIKYEPQNDLQLGTRLSILAFLLIFTLLLLILKGVIIFV